MDGRVIDHPSQNVATTLARASPVGGTPEHLLSDVLNAKTPIEGQYLSGQDVVNQGIQGHSGVDPVCGQHRPEAFQAAERVTPSCTGSCRRSGARPSFP